MLCEHCKKKIIIERHVWNLFHHETHSICHQCYQRYPLFPSTTTWPVDQGMAIMHTMITQGEKIEPICYQSFLKAYYQDYLKHHVKSTFIYEDYFDETLWHTLDSLGFGDLYVVTLYENTHEKGEER